MKVSGINLNWIVVKDIDAAVKFYTDVMGLTLQKFTKEYGWAELAGPEGSILGLSQESPHFNMKAGTNAVFTITVDDIVKARDEMKKKGVRIEGDILEVPGEVKLQTVIDNDGNMLQLVELTRKA